MPQLPPLGIREKNIVKVAIAVLIGVLAPNFLASQAADYFQAEVDRGRNLEADLREVRGNRTDVVEQGRLYETFQDSYEGWYGRGVVTEFPDTEPWRNVMYDIKQKRDLSVIDFTFGEGQRVLPEDSVYTEDSTTSIGILPMHVSMPMLHGMDIFMFFADLRARADGVFFPLSCEMTRVESGFVSELRDNLRGECDVVWVVIQDPERERV